MSGGTAETGSRAGTHGGARGTGGTVQCQRWAAQPRQPGSKVGWSKIGPICHHHVKSTASLSLCYLLDKSIS